MKITVDRSSVCMGNDIDSHKKTVELCDGANYRDLIEVLRGSGFFASVSGNNVVWVLTAGGDYCVLAYYTKTGHVSQLSPEIRLDKVSEKGRLNFSYYSSPAKWKSVIERFYINADSSVKRGAWLTERDYCEKLSRK